MFPPKYFGKHIWNSICMLSFSLFQFLQNHTLYHWNLNGGFLRGFYPQQLEEEEISSHISEITGSQKKCKYRIHKTQAINAQSALASW